MADKTPFNTPVGRFVSGSLTELRTKDAQGKPIDPAKQQYEFGLAIRKDDPGLSGLFQTLTQVARNGYANQPSVLPRIDQWFQTMNGFSMKCSDGDKVNARGQTNENTQGHFVFWFSTSFPIQACGPDNVQIDPAAIKRGWYIDVSGTSAINGNTDHTAGVYLNPTWVRLIGEGDEIAGGISAEDAFGNAPAPSLPPGARQVGSTPQPQYGTGAPGGGMQQPQMPGGAPMQPQQPQMPGGNPMQPQQPQMPGGNPMQPQQPQMPGGNPMQPQQPQMPGGNPATGGPGSMPQGAPAGMPQQGGAGGPAGTASPGDVPNTGYPPHPGVLNN